MKKISALILMAAVLVSALSCKKDPVPETLYSFAPVDNLNLPFEGGRLPEEVSYDSFWPCFVPVSMKNGGAPEVLPCGPGSGTLSFEYAGDADKHFRHLEFSASKYGLEGTCFGFVVQPGTPAGTSGEVQVKYNSADGIAFLQRFSLRAAQIDPGYVAMESITLDKSSATIMCGQSVKFTATVLPKNATDQDVEWVIRSTSSGAVLAELDNDGNVTAKPNVHGIVNISAICGGKEATCSVSIDEMGLFGLSEDKTTYISVGGEIYPFGMEYSYNWDQDLLPLKVIRVGATAPDPVPAEIPAKDVKTSGDSGMYTLWDKGSILETNKNPSELEVEVKINDQDMNLSFPQSRNSYETELNLKIFTGNGNSYEKSYPIHVRRTGKPVNILGTYWATCNLGAQSDYEIGDYYAWGEIEPKEHYTPWNYKWYDNAWNLTKYHEANAFIDYSDDPARQNWGGRWRMPNMNDLTHLYSTWKATTINGVKGAGIYDERNMMVLFFPAGGHRNTSIFEPEKGYYWQREKSPIKFPWLQFDTNAGNIHGTSENLRPYEGCLVRPIFTYD